MTTKEKILLYFRDINYAYNDCTRLDSLEKGLSELEEVVRCRDCRYMTEHYDTDGNVPYWTCSEWDSGTDYDGYCHYGERKDDD